MSHSKGRVRVLHNFPPQTGGRQNLLHGLATGEWPRSRRSGLPGVSGGASKARPRNREGFPDAGPRDVTHIMSAFWKHDFAITFILLIAMIVYYRQMPTIATLLSPPFLLLVAVTTLPVGVRRPRSPNQPCNVASGGKYVIER